MIDVSAGTVCQSHEKKKKCWADTGDQCCQSLENKNFEKVWESIEKANSGVYISENAIFIWFNLKEGFLWLHNELSWRIFKMNTTCHEGAHVDTPHPFGPTPTGIQGPF